MKAHDSCARISPIAKPRKGAVSRWGACAPYRHVFAADSCPKARQFLQQNHKIDKVHADICAESFQEGHTSVVVCGFPCQAFSMQGLGQGWEDRKGRGKSVIEAMLQHINQAKPE
eukprot:100423-Amphidinium_carterae.1